MKKKLILLMMLVTVMFALCSCSEEKAEESEEQAPIQNANDYVNSLSSDKDDKKEDDEEDEDDNQYVENDDNSNNDVENEVESAFNDMFADMKIKEYGKRSIGFFEFEINRTYEYEMIDIETSTIGYMNSDWSEVIAMTVGDKNQYSTEEEFADYMIKESDGTNVEKKNSYTNENGIVMQRYNFNVKDNAEYFAYVFSSNTKIVFVLAATNTELSDGFYKLIDSMEPM